MDDSTERRTRPDAPDHAFVVGEWVDAQGDAPAGFADGVADALATAVHGTADHDVGAEPPVVVAAHARRLGLSVRVSWGVAAAAVAAALVLALSPWSGEHRDTGAAMTGLHTPGGAVARVPQGCDVVPWGGLPRQVPTPGAAPAAAGPASSGSMLDRLRGQTQGVLVARCSPCHFGGNPAAEGDALDVFDAATEQWWTSLSTRQVGVLGARVGDAPGVGAEHTAVVDAFVAAELADRPRSLFVDG